MEFRLWDAFQCFCGASSRAGFLARRSHGGGVEGTNQAALQHGSDDLGDVNPDFRSVFRRANKR